MSDGQRQHNSLSASRQITSSNRHYEATHSGSGTYFNGGDIGRDCHFHYNVTQTVSSTNLPTPASRSTSEDKFAFLKQFDTVFLIDDSGSMAGRSWNETRAAIEALAPICINNDDNGIDIYFLNAPQQEHFHNIKSAETVRRIFHGQRPAGETPTGMRLDQIIRPYLRKLEAKGSNPANPLKPLNIIVITDGVPTDDVESVIVPIARKLDELQALSWQLGIQFFQVGDEDGAADALRDLDDNLTKRNDCPRDIVDTVPYSEGRALSDKNILKVVIGSVHRKYDKQSLS